MPSGIYTQVNGLAFAFFVERPSEHKMKKNNEGDFLNITLEKVCCSRYPKGG